jgi:hypothetical protein
VLRVHLARLDDDLRNGSEKAEVYRQAAVDVGGAEVPVRTYHRPPLYHGGQWSDSVVVNAEPYGGEAGEQYLARARAIVHLPGFNATFIWAQWLRTRYECQPSVDLSRGVCMRELVVQRGGGAAHTASGACACGKENCADRLTCGGEVNYQLINVTDVTGGAWVADDPTGDEPGTMFCVSDLIDGKDIAIDTGKGRQKGGQKTSGGAGGARGGAGGCAGGRAGGGGGKSKKSRA